MTTKTTVPKEQRPKAIETLLRDFRRDNPGMWMSWKDVLQSVGGSERDFAQMMRSAKAKILADEAVVAAAPELPAEMHDEFQRFIQGLWKTACDIADVSASELRQARQADRESIEHERAEHDQMISSLADDRDALSRDLEAAQQELSEVSLRLVETQGELRDAKAALDEMRNLFATFAGYSSAGSEEPNQDRSSEKRGTSRRKTGAKTPDEGKRPPEDPLSPELPMS